MTIKVDLEALAKAIGFSDDDPSDDEMVEFNEALRAEVFPGVVVITDEDVKATEKLKLENEKLKSANEDYGTALKSMSDRVDTLTATDSERRFADIADGYDVVTKKRDVESAFIGDHAKKIVFMSKLEKSFGEDSDELKDYIVEQREMAKATANSVDFREIGVDSGRGGDTRPPKDAWSAIVAKANSLVKEGTCKNFDEGVDYVVENDVELSEAYTNQMRQ